MSARPPFTPVLWCLVAAGLFGASAPAARVLLRDAGPFTLAGLFYLGAAAGVLPLSGIFTRGGAPRLRGNGRSLARLGAAVVSGGMVAPVLLLAGLQRAPAASVSLWLSVEAAATALLAWMFFAEHMPARACVAVAVICGCGALLASPGQQASPVAGLLVALACLCWGLDNNLTALIDGLTPAQCALTKGLVAGGVNLAFGLWLETAPTAARTVAGALLLGAASYGLSLVLYIAGSQQLGAARSQIIFATAPFWGAALSWTLLAERVSIEQALAAPMILGALWLLHTERHEHAHTHETVRHIHWHRHDDDHHDHAHPGLSTWIGHTHEHSHDDVTHAHAHRPDLHHRHPH